ncbi:MAG TPA: amino acid adenylation domain-containing protein [Acidimicrobiales bacterium]|nr:amino acid adenylation domain-containing protein [Acidimicrobiales bacterium]
MATGPGCLRVPLSLAQEQIWWMERFAPAPGFLNQAFRHRFDFPADPAVLADAVRTLTERHESLRAAFPVEDGLAFQSIAPDVEVRVHTTDLRDAPPSSRRSQLLRHQEVAVETGFDTTSLPLFAVHLYLLDEGSSEVLMVLDHIVSDPTSLAVLESELAEVYGALAAGEEPALAPLPIEFSDFAVWQREWMSEDRVAEYHRHWKDTLRGVATVHPLPYTDTVRDPADRSDLTATSHGYAVIVPPAVGDALRRLPGSSSYAASVAAVAALVARATGQADTLLLTSVGGRDRAELTGIVGDFGGLSLLRVDLSGDPSLDVALERARAAVHGVLEHQHLPLYHSVRAFNDESGADLNVATLPVALHFFHAAPRRWIPGASVIAQPPEREGFFEFDLPEASKPLEFQFYDDATTLWAELHYRPDHYDRDTVAEVAADLHAALAAVAHHPELRLSELGVPTPDAGRLPALDETERHSVLVAWNDTAAPFPDTVGVHHLVEAQVRRSPAAVAVVDASRSLTYAELDERADGLARRLRSIGVGPDVVVGLCMSRNVDMVAALLAVLKSGGAYLPLDPSYPPERLRFMLDDSGARVVVTEGAVLDRLPAHPLPVLSFDEDTEPAGGPPPAAEPPFDPEQLAYVVYTSGSTGQPKGVAVPHRAMVNLLTTMRDRPGLDAGDTVVAVTTLSFDIAGLELCLPLTVGARLVVAPAAAASAPDALAALLDSSGATVFQATPATWRMLVESDWPGRPGLTAFCGGEALQPALAEALLGRGLVLWNMYGPTETTVYSLITRVTEPAEAVSIGQPVANTTAYVLDAAMEPVPVGTPGELHVGGAGLARGYLHRPELTAERFVPHPFDRRPGARLYKTGDLVRWRPDGTVEYLGRLDHQVKIRGYRIEPGEIEVALGAHPHVRAAVVVGAADPAGGQRLVAYVVADSPGPTVDSLRDHLLRTLPSYMVPSAFVTLDALPLTPNGKVDRKALPSPDEARSVLGAPFVDARSDLERGLLALWSEVLGVERIGVDDNFFDLGGHSLLAVRAISQINAAHQTDLDLASLHRAPTVAALAPLVASSGKGARTGSPRLRRLDRGS